MPRTRRKNRSVESARPAWMEKPSRLGITGKAVVVTLICVATIYPFLTVLSTSLSDSTDIANANGLVLFPLHPTFAAYETIFSGGTAKKCRGRWCTSETDSASGIWRSGSSRSVSRNSA